MRKYFEEPKMNIDVLTVEDVITTSPCTTDCDNVSEPGGGF